MADLFAPPATRTAYNDFGGDTIANLATHLAPLTSLQRLFVRYSNLTGPLACGLTEPHGNLTILSVSGNEITGNIPECIMQVGGIAQQPLCFEVRLCPSW